MIGETLSHYRSLAKIGDDASGALYRAIDTKWNRPVALKILAPSLADDPERRVRVKRNVLAASRLDHPHVAVVYEFSYSEGVHFAVMEAPEGESIFQLLDRARPYRRDLLRFARQISSALAAAHDAGMVHGPLNPAYIFISPTQQIKFYDFGFGVLEPPPESEEARRLFAGESASYFSPEQIGGVGPDTRSDVFSFGALLFHMTSGIRAFSAPSVSETWKAILTAEPKPLAQLTSRAPLGMDRLLEQCLRKNPQRRYRQMGDIEPVLERMADAYYRNPERTVSFLARNRGRITKVAVAALAATAAVAAAVFWLQDGSGGELVTGRQLHQITRSGGFDTDPAVSADGSKLAYASDRSRAGNLDIWIQPVDSAEARRLTNDPADDREPAFSPDGKTIAFRSERGEGGIYLVPTEGGEARLLEAGGRRPRYSPDGRWIAYWVGPPEFGPKPDGAYKMFVVPPSGGEPRLIRAGFASCTHPTWSPDSKSLLFVGRPGNGTKDQEASDWWVTSLDGERLYDTGACRLFRGENILLPSESAIPGDWKGNGVFFSIPSTEASSIWRVSIAPGSQLVPVRPLRVTQDKEKNLDVQPAALGNGGVVFSRQSYNADIWGIPVVPNEGKVTGPPKRWTTAMGPDVSPSSPADGGIVVFQANRTGHYNLWYLDLSSGKPSPLTASPEEQVWPLISPDGSKVAFTEMRIGRVEHFYKPIGASSKEVLCDRDCGPAVSGWSGDSKLVLIDSISHGAKARLAVNMVELLNRRATRLLEDPRYDVHQARFSPDGRSIVFSARDDTGSSRLFIAPFHSDRPSLTAEWAALTDGGSWDAAPQWSPDGKLVYFASTRDGYRCIWAQRLNAAGLPSGAAFGVAHLHSMRCAPTILPFDNTDLFVGRDQILLSLGDQTGNIWGAKVSE